MNTRLTFKLCLIFISSMMTSPILYILQAKLLYGNTLEQNMEQTVLNLLNLAVMTILGTLYIVHYASDIEKKIKNIEWLSHENLIKLAEKSMNLPVFMQLFFIIPFSIGSLISFLAGFHIGASAFTNYSTLFIQLAAILVVPSLPLFMAGYATRDINKNITKQIHYKKLSAEYGRLPVTRKTAYVFSATVVSLIIYSGTISYYFATSKYIEATKANLINEYRILEHAHPVFKTENPNREKLIELAMSINFDSSITRVIANTEGDIIFSTKQISLHNKIVDKYLAEALNSGKNGALYENHFNNIIAYGPIGKEYRLLLVKNISSFTSIYSSYFFWMGLALIVGLGVVFLVLYNYNGWFVSSIKDLSDLLYRMRQKDFSSPGGKNSNDEIGDMVDHYNILREGINDFLLQVIENTISVSNASKSLNSVAHLVSQGANQQASTAEEVSATMDQLYTTILSNNDILKETVTSSNTAFSDLEINMHDFTRIIQLVENISTKTSVIAEIASKTDMLAINAAIQAARSKEVNGGFVVIADEIRKLSDKTKKASIEIGKLSEEGMNLSRLASDKLNKILPEINSTSKSISQIVEINNEQFEGLRVINDAIQQFSMVINQNSASSEQLSASASQLTLESKNLLNKVSSYKLKSNQNKVKMN